MKKIVLLILILIFTLSFCACGKKEKDTTIDTAQEAISAVKSDNGAFSTASRIASELGFYFYSEPNYGVCSAEMNEEGSWTVILKGNMSGFTNETKTDFDNYGFIFTTTITTDGKISYGNAEILE